MLNQETSQSDRNEARLELIADPVTEPVDELEAKIATTLGKSTLDFLEKTLSEQLGANYENNELGLVEKINLLLVLASQKKINIPSKIIRIIKNLDVILPNGQLDTSRLKHLSVEKRKYFLQIVSSVILLLSVGLGIGRAITSRYQQAEKGPIATLPSGEINDTQRAEAEARAQFERLYSHDLETVVGEMGWEKFLLSYAAMNNESLWSKAEVFQLLRTQQPRYWGYYAVAYPQIFLDEVADSGITPIEFMSSSGQERFFYYLESQQNNDINWFDVWTMDELLAALKKTDVNWGVIVADNQAIFVETLSKEELKTVVFMLASDLNHTRAINTFISDYDEKWDQVWSRRELLDALKNETPIWESLINQNPALFSSTITSEELTQVIEFISLNNSGVYPRQSDLTIISDYYKLKLYEVVKPAELVGILRLHFSEDVVQQFLTNYPELTIGESDVVQEELAKNSIESLFQTKAINYVLANYDDFQSIYPISDIVNFLRTDNYNSNYIFITGYPELFNKVSFSDEEWLSLAYQDDVAGVTGSKTEFFQSYFGDSGWHKQISIEKLLALGRENPNFGMYEVAMDFPEIFLPHFTDTDMYYLWLYNDREFSERKIIDTTDPLWQPFMSPERRRSMLEIAKQNSEYGWQSAVGSNPYFFADILTFDEIGEILLDYYSSPLRDSQLWQSNITPQWEYAFIKDNMDQDSFVYMISNDPTYFGELLTRDDKLLVLQNNPQVILNNYHYWQQTFSPEFMLNYFQSGQSIENYADLIIENEPIFGHLFYQQKYDFADLIRNGGEKRIFYTNPQTGLHYYEEWSEFASFEEIFSILKSFGAGRNEILSRPDLFFELVEYSDLDLLLQSEYGILTLMAEYEEWKELWSVADIYAATQRNNTPYAAVAFFDESGVYASEFMALMQPEDLNFLVGSYTTELAYSFSADLKFLLEKWTAEEILVSLKREHPESWAAFATEDATSFKDLFAGNDLDVLVQYGAKPPGLVNYGWWGTGQILDAYRVHLPEKWGEMILTHSDIFLDEVTSRNIPLQSLLETSDLNAIRESMNGWESLWSREEIEALIEAIESETEAGQSQ